MNWNIFRRRNVPWDDIELNIKPLVEAVHIRYKTKNSCEGHLNHGCPYPWVELNTNQNYNNIQERLTKYNSANKIGWTLHELINMRKLMPECKVYSELSEYVMSTMNSGMLEKLKTLADDCPSLELLQDGARDLARYLKESWK